MTSVNGFLKWFFDIGNWLAKVMYIHILWVLFTLMGLVVFGFMPATAALFTVIHKGFDGKSDPAIFKTFYETFKTQFLKANALGLLLLGLCAFLYVDMNISKQVIQSFFVHMFLLIVCFLYFITVLYFFPVFARYKLSYFLYFKQSFFIAFARPFETIAMIICLVLLFYLFTYLPVLLFFAGSSLIAYPLAWFAYRACVQIEERKVN
ncbi:hypothetical protein CFK37_08565 [Virgibacillus phasianinus]|uniref:DUF624 domain-containing protein n=1 Tax=Virgibacillus phasianinus TaxID=2017483 RepID=A0A220U270_9BACI|nr:DUF624 domain-containing protein [Virgibacillus phasianinus]ASK62209.1 hypothetical protein CFK37_08565 [Virgibacillus phasianinus]